MNLRNGNCQVFLPLSHTPLTWKVVSFIWKNFVTFKKQGWVENINKLAARSALRSWEVTIWKDIWNNIQIKIKKTNINKEELRKHLIKVENEYQEKLELGKEIYEIMREGVVSYQALTRDMKEEVDLYIENQADF